MLMFTWYVDVSPFCCLFTNFESFLSQIPSRLPYMFLEQHVPPTSATSSSTNERLFDNLFNTSLSTSSLNTSHSHSITHLVVLVHGFLGCEADMWLLAQALHLIFPSREHLRTFIPHYCEASAFSEKLEVMGNRLADQLFHYFKGEKIFELSFLIVYLLLKYTFVACYRENVGDLLG